MPHDIFGWNYPPGAAGDPNAPWNQKEPPCEVCGKYPDECICPECPECGEAGSPACYEKHGLVLSEEQKASKKQADEEYASSQSAMIAWEEQEEERLLAEREQEREDSPDV